MNEQIRSAFSWVLNVLLIDLLHNLQVLLALAFGLKVMSRAAQAKDLALLLDADLSFRKNQSSASISIPNCLETRLAKSSCISKFSIFRRHLSFCLTIAVLSTLDDSNTVVEFSMNSFSNALSSLEINSYFIASSFRVSFSASMATYALNLASYFFLVCFIVKSYYFQLKHLY